MYCSVIKKLHNMWWRKLIYSILSVNFNGLVEIWNLKDLFKYRLVLGTLKSIYKHNKINVFICKINIGL